MRMTRATANPAFLKFQILATLAICFCIASPSFSSQDELHRSTIKVNGIEISLLPFNLPSTNKRFWLSQFEITNQQYLRFVQLSGYDGSDHPSSKVNEPFFHNYRRNPRWIKELPGRFPSNEANHPACYLNWWHAKKFCDWLSEETGKTVRLPTVEEWTFAAAGNEKRAYPWGNTWQVKRCNSSGGKDGFPKSAPVGSFAKGATPEGVHDMAGNIWEWSEDQVLLGGPWCLGPEELKISFHGKESIDQANDKFGFRIVVEQPQHNQKQSTR